MTNSIKQISTILGEVSILNALMGRAGGYGQYVISIYIEFEGVKKTISYHSTDSQLFDRLHFMDNKSEEKEYLMEHQKYPIERAIEDYVSSL